MAGRNVPLKLEEYYPYRLSVLSNTIARSIARIYSDRFELTIPEWRVLATVAEYPGLSAVEVATRTAQDKMAVSRAVARLLKKGRLTQQRAADDRRRYLLKLSSEGRRIYAQLAPLALQMERKLLEELSPEQLAVLDECVAILQQRANELAP